MEIKNLSVYDKDTVLLDAIHLSFYCHVNTFICGTSASGKTLLLKAIANQVKYAGEIEKNGSVEVVFDRNAFYTNSLEDELKYLALEEAEKEIVHHFIPKERMKQNPNELDIQMKKIVLLCAAIVKKPVLLIVDSLFSFLKKEIVDEIFSYAKENGITIVSVSNRIEEALNYDYMIVLDQGRVAMEGKTIQVLEQEKLLKRLGIGLPFYVDLSLQLKSYGLIDKMCLSKEELVSMLWK